MKTKILSFLAFCFFILLGKLNSALAGGGGEPAEELEKTVDTQGLEGLTLFVANLYNDDRLFFALLVVGTMVALGIIVSFGTDLIFRAKKKK